MAINKKLIHFKHKSSFENETANNNILDTSICFIQDSKEISTHGTVYKTVNWSVLKPNLISFTINGTEYQAEEGMTWEDWVNSEYNTDDVYIKSTLVFVNDDYFVVKSNYKGVLFSDLIENYDYRIQLY